MFTAFSNKTVPSSNPIPDTLTLEAILQGQTQPPFSLQDFTQYLERKYCTENLYFYNDVIKYDQDCDKFKLDLAADPPSRHFDFSDKTVEVLSPYHLSQFKLLKTQFDKILDKYISSKAIYEINITAEIRQQLLRSRREQQLYDPKLFIPVRSAIVDLLQKGAFIPFLTDTGKTNRTITATNSIKKKRSFIRRRGSNDSLRNSNGNGGGNVATIREETATPPSSPSSTANSSIDQHEVHKVATTGFMKRFTSSLWAKPSSQHNENEGNAGTATPPNTPPAVKAVGWKQINIQDVGAFKPSNTSPIRRSNDVYCNYTS